MSTLKLVVIDISSNLLDEDGRNHERTYDLSYTSSSHGCSNNLLLTPVFWGRANRKNYSCLPHTIMNKSIMDIYRQSLQCLGVKTVLCIVKTQHDINALQKSGWKVLDCFDHYISTES